MKTTYSGKTKTMVLTLGAAFLLASAGCTSDFERINTDPNGLQSSQISVKNFMDEAQLSIYYNQSDGNWEYQLIQNLNADLYSGYLAVPTPFSGNNNNSLYYMSDRKSVV